MQAVASFEDRFFDELTRRFDRLETAIGKNTRLTQNVATDTKDLTKRVVHLENRPTVLGRIGDKRLVTLFFVALVVFLFIIANITKTVLPTWLK